MVEFEIIWISPQFAVKVTEWVQQFIEGEDYQECKYDLNDFGNFLKLPNKKSKKKGRGGHNKKLYEVTPDCFKNMLTRYFFEIIHYNIIHTTHSL